MKSNPRYILNGFDDFTQADFARECSQNLQKLSVLDIYVVGLFYESVNKSDCILEPRLCAVVRSPSQEPPSENHCINAVRKITDNTAVGLR